METFLPANLLAEIVFKKNKYYFQNVQVLHLAKSTSL
jgi:hypothetical protein